MPRRGAARSESTSLNLNLEVDHEKIHSSEVQQRVECRGQLSILAPRLRRSPACSSLMNTNCASNPPALFRVTRMFLSLSTLSEAEGGGRVDGRPLWVDGPNAAAGQFAAENRHLIAKLLTLVGLPTAGNVGALIPQLAGLEFDARLVLAVDSRSGRTYNALAEIYTDDAP